MKYVMEFGNNGEMAFNNDFFGNFGIKRIDSSFSFQHKVVGNMFGKETFADKESEGTVTAKVI